jgi:hypothetical protein
MNTYELRCDGVKQYRKKGQTEDGSQGQIFRSDLRYGWIHGIYERPAQLGNWIGNVWDHFEYKNRCPLMLMNWSYLHQYESIGYNQFPS